MLPREPASPILPAGVAERMRLIEVALRLDFASFVEKAATSLVPGQLAWNWHLDAICHALDQVRLGKTRRLIINLPPRSLKSVIASVAFPAFVLGHDPSKRIICVSYAQDLATKHSNDFRRCSAAAGTGASFLARGPRAAKIPRPRLRWRAAACALPPRLAAR